MLLELISVKDKQNTIPAVTPGYSRVDCALEACEHYLRDSRIEKKTPMRQHLLQYIINYTTSPRVIFTL
jgi:hypothetical protein